MFLGVLEEPSGRIMRTGARVGLLPALKVFNTEHGCAATPSQASLVGHACSVTLGFRLRVDSDLHLPLLLVSSTPSRR